MDYHQIFVYILDKYEYKIRINLFPYEMFEIKNIFKPGYTTKKRGWGLGLSLSKRIIENYHKGKLTLKETKINFGSTFEIELNKSYSKV